MFPTMALRMLLRGAKHTTRISGSCLSLINHSDFSCRYKQHDNLQTDYNTYPLRVFKGMDSAWSSRLNTSSNTDKTDVITECPPCQGFSFGNQARHAGIRKGTGNTISNEIKIYHCTNFVFNLYGQHLSPLVKMGFSNEVFDEKHPSCQRNTHSPDNPSHRPAPLLDGIIGELTYDSTLIDGAENPNIEIHEQLILKGPVSGSDDTVSFDRMELRQDGDIISIQFENMNSTITDPVNTLNIASGFFEAAMQVFKQKPNHLGKILMGDIETCAEYDLPFKLNVNGFELIDDPYSTITIDALDIDYTVADPEHDCVMDLELTSDGIMIMDTASAMSLFITEFDIDSYWPLKNDHPPRNHQKPYIIDSTAADLIFSMNNTEQIKVETIELNNALKPDSLGNLIDSGFITAYSDMIIPDIPALPIDHSGISMPRVWNAMSDLVFLRGLQHFRV